MQLTTIALATILITFFITSSVRCTTSEKLIPRRSSTGSIKEYTDEVNRRAKAEAARKATIEKERQARKEKAQQESLKLKEGGGLPSTRPGAPKTGLKPTTPAPKLKPAPKPFVGTFPPPTPKTEKESEKPTPSSAKKPAATPFHPKPPSPPKTPVTPTSAASMSSVKPESAPTLLPPPGPLTETPQQFREKQESQGSRVAGLMQKFQSQPSSTLPSKSARDAPPKPSGVSPRASAIPEDKEFVNFKEAIQKGNYSDAMRIVHKLPKEKSREPYGRHLASLDVSKILEMMATYTEKTLSEVTVTDEGETTEHYPNPYPKITSGLFLLYASDDKSTKLLKSLGTEVGDDALLFSMEHGIALLPEGFIKLFKKISEEKRSDALESIAKCTYKYGKYNVFDDIIATLHTEGLLDEGLMNFAANAAFLEVCRHNNLARAQAVYKGATIIPMMYGKAMYVSCRGPRDNNDVFNWLLSNACADDVLCANFSLGEKNEHFKRVGAILAEKFMKTRHKTRYVKRLA